MPHSRHVAAAAAVMGTLSGRYIFPVWLASLVRLRGQRIVCHASCDANCYQQRGERMCAWWIPEKLANGVADAARISLFGLKPSDPFSASSPDFLGSGLRLQDF